MTVQEAKEELKQEYLKGGFTLDNETLDTLFFTFKEDKVKISKTDIEQYSVFSNSKRGISTKPYDTSLLSKNYREQMVTISNNDGRSNNLFRRSKKLIFGDETKDELYVEISRASSNFINFFRFQDQYLTICKDRLFIFGESDEAGYTELFEELYTPMTIKVFNLKAASIDDAIEISTNVINGCLYSLSSLRQVSIEQVEEWPIRKRGEKTSKDFIYGENIEGHHFPLPKVQLNETLIKFYQQATSTDIPSLKYLAYYQILEYFFLKVADENLYNNLARRINDLKFKTNATHLDRLIQDVTNHKRDNDETEMLKNVIKKYVDENDLIDFINCYETFLEQKIYTTRRTIFGNDISATALNSGHVFGNISKTIKAIRNALVHSSDRYDRNDRYIPYNKEGTELIQNELPLIKFLAEKVIISSSTNV